MRDELTSAGGRSTSPQGGGAWTRSARDELLHAIETNIVPGLVEHWRDASLPLVNAATAERLALLAMHGHLGGAEHLIADLRGRGASEDDILLGLFPSAIRCMGRMWEDDDCSFAEVTVGTLRLERLFDEASALRDAAPGPGAPLVLLTAVPGAQHAFGLRIVRVYFERAGWGVRSSEFSTCGELAACVAATAFTAVGVSAACDVHGEALIEAVAAVRRCSLNREAVILVGGPLVLRGGPGYPAEVGADGTAPDAALAPAIAAALLATRAARRETAHA